MVRRRRRMHSSDAARWLTFVPADWPGECMVERFEAWRAAGAAAYRADGSLSALQIIRAHRDVRRGLVHVDCAAHPPVEECPTGWVREGDSVRFTVRRWDGSDAIEIVLKDSPREAELLDARARGRSSSRAVSWFDPR